MWIFLLAGAVLLLAAVGLAYPLLMQRPESYLSPQAASTPFSERDALLEAMSELETEYAGGKLSDTDYGREKERLQRQYLEVVRGEPA